MKTSFFRSLRPIAFKPAGLVFLCHLAACGEKGGESGVVDCDTSASASVNVVVTDSLAEILPDASVTWAKEGEDAQSCDEFGTQFACAWEVAGALTITASAPGYVTASQTVNVEAGECHVETQNLTFRLEADGA